MPLHLAQEPFTQNSLFFCWKRETGERKRGPALICSLIKQGRVLQEEIFLFPSGKEVQFKKRLLGNSFQRRLEKARYLLTQLYPLINFLRSSLDILEVFRLSLYYAIYKGPKRNLIEICEILIYGMSRISQFIHLFNKYLLSTYHVLGVVLGARLQQENK